MIYTDGSCMGNPGPAGYGACLVSRLTETRDSKQRLDSDILISKESERAVEEGSNGTNNIAELKAVGLGIKLWQASRTENLEVKSLYLATDSMYSINMLRRVAPFNAKKNVALIERLRQELKPFWEAGGVMEHVKGHSRHFYNDYVDSISKEVISKSR